MGKESGTVLKNIIWRFLEKCGAQGVTLIVSIVLARLLDPAAYGTVGIVTAIISILQTFINSGLGNALIQKKNVDSVDFSSVFFFNCGLCLIFYGAMWFLAPKIASFYGISDLVLLIRVMSVIIVVSAIGNIQQAYIAKHMMFKKNFFSTIIGTLGSAVVGIYMAYKGYGVWALVVQQLFNVLANVFVLLFTVKWMPTFEFSWKRLKGLISYGWKLVVSDLMSKTYGEARQLLMGKMYSTDDLAFFTKGRLFPNMIISNIDTSISSVLFPVISNHQDNIEQVRAVTRRTIKISTYIICPLMIGLAVCAESVVAVILTDKWLASVPYIQIFCFTYMLYPIHGACVNAIKAIGRSDVVLKMDIGKFISGFAVLACTVWFGPLVIGYGLIIESIISLVINTWNGKNQYNYGFMDVMKDIIPSVLLSVVMAVVVYIIGCYVDLPEIFELILKVVVGALIYITGSYFAKMEGFFYVIHMAKTLLVRHAK